MSKKASRDTEQYVVRGGDSGSYDVLSGPYDSQDEAVNVSAMNDGSSTMSGTQLDSSSIGHDYRFGSYDGPNYVIKIDGEIVYSSPSPLTQEELEAHVRIMQQRPHSRMEIGKLSSAHTATDWDQADFDANAAFWSGRADAERAKEQRRQELYAWKGQEVVVVGGRKIPKGTRGICFYSGAGQYGWRIGFKDASGQEYWTDLNNVELASEHTGSRRTAGYPDSGGYYPFDEPELTPEIQARMEQLRQRIDGWRGGDEDAVTEMLQHYNSLADEYGLPRYGDDTPHYASAPEGVYKAERLAVFVGVGRVVEGEDDPDGGPSDDDFYDDFAHEGKIERHAIADEFDLRPLHTRVATAFLKKG